MAWPSNSATSWPNKCSLSASDPGFSSLYPVPLFSLDKLEILYRRPCILDMTDRKRNHRRFWRDSVYSPCLAKTISLSVMDTWNHINERGFSVIPLMINGRTQENKVNSGCCPLLKNLTGSFLWTYRGFWDLISFSTRMILLMSGNLCKWLGEFLSKHKLRDLVYHGRSSGRPCLLDCLCVRYQVYLRIRGLSIASMNE